MLLGQTRVHIYESSLGVDVTADLSLRSFCRWPPQKANPLARDVGLRAGANSRVQLNPEGTNRHSRGRLPMFQTSDRVPQLPPTRQAHPITNEVLESRCLPFR